MPDSSESSRRWFRTGDLDWEEDLAFDDPPASDAPAPDPESPGATVLAALNDLLELPDEPPLTPSELEEMRARRRVEKEAEQQERIRKTKADYAEAHGKASELLASLFMSQADLDRYSQRMDRDYEDLSVEFNKGFRRAVDDTDATLSGLDAELDRMAREQITGANAAQRTRLVAMLTELQQQAEGHRQAAGELDRDAQAIINALEATIRTGELVGGRDSIREANELHTQATALRDQADEIDTLVRRYIEQLDAAGSGPA